MAEQLKFSITNPNIIQRYIYKDAAILILAKFRKEFKVKKSIIQDATIQYFSVIKPFENITDLIIDIDTILFFKLFPQDGYYLEFVSKVTEVIESDNSPTLIKLEFPSSMIRIQRRQTFRVPISLLGTLIINKSNVLQNDDKNQDVDSNAALLDLSLGGVLVASNLRAGFNMRGAIIFFIPDYSEAFHIDIEIRRIQKIRNPKSKYLFHYGLQFLDMNESTNQKLSRYIIKLQIQNKAIENQ
ncbi:hypothetical protein BVX93_02005 [bacterium B13(2017)]|nr:hypothetical protein BVX93_02005 [bacterium B13(2017)]